MRAFETRPGKHMQIDFGERLVEIGGVKIKAFLFVAIRLLAPDLCPRLS
ncbi:hypothetical protein JDN40_00820 [Rhodomicrobium vannielii ATCC 17100]|nr:hypothetical protein [Rhodomicrobium vannielii]MBJ7532674.1 hypothetical protein [Rhodomicrobium vannielii ATCC 17100]